MCERGEIEERNLEPQKAEIPELITKVCTKCGERKSLSEFGLRKDSKDGYSHYCKACRNARAEEKRLRNPEYALIKEMALNGKKRCSKCKTFLDLSEFYDDKRSTDGKVCACKKCVSAESKKRNSTVCFEPLTVGKKVCSTCHLLLPVSSFSRAKYNSTGLSSSCKKCTSLKNKDIRKELNYSFDPNSYKKCCKCFELKSALDFYPCKNNKDGLDSMCKECDKKRGIERRAALSFEPDPNGVKICCCCEEKKSSSCFYRSHTSTDGLGSYCKVCINKKNALMRKENRLYKLRAKVRDRFKGFLKSHELRDEVGKGAALKFLGCTVGELAVYLENQFYSNVNTGEMMTWENHGRKGWHIDHIIPLSRVDLTDPKQLARVTHYSNLRPMWAEENNRKSAKLPENWNLQEWLEELEQWIEVCTTAA
jgi:hypothetical protein